MIDFQEMITNKFSAMRAEELKTMDIMTVGELIAKLEPIVAKQSEVIKKYGHEATVMFDFEYLKPTSFHSWRGVYAELALGFTEEGEEKPVSKLLEQARAVVGKTFTGYKGGDFVMGKTTPIWIANYSHSGQTALVDILDEEYSVILITKYLKG